MSWRIPSPPFKYYLIQFNTAAALTGKEEEIKHLMKIIKTLQERAGTSKVE